MTGKLTENIYLIKVPLPNNPLRDLNSYIIKTSGRSLIIDTGFNMPECLDALRSGIEELGIDIGKADLFITHLHSDHSGLIGELEGFDGKIYMGAADVEFLRYALHHGDEYIREYNEKYLSWGYPEDVLRASLADNPAFKNAINRDFPFVTVNDGDVISIGGIKLTCVHTPGHTPGHMCLYLESEKILFSGDCVLFDITPNIAVWDALDDALGSYFESLDKIEGIDISKAFASHRGSDGDFYARVRELKKHHEDRLDELLSIVGANSGIDCYNAAAKMTWSIRARDWDDFPATQKWFAVGEAAAHLRYLEKRGKIEKHLNGWRIADGISR